MPPVERTTPRRAGAGSPAGTVSPGVSTTGSGRDGASTTGTVGAGAGGASVAPPALTDPPFAPPLALAAFGADLASSTIGSPRSPRLSASRRTRSADGSSMLDEWLLTPILSSSARSRTTWFSTPNSRASS
jgi:hypothetical protein